MNLATPFDLRAFDPRLVEALNADLTIVLPVHNAERNIREAVVGILDLAEILARRLQIAIVDDGSTDGTFEAASELAREFPQVRVMHQPAQRGHGEALEQVRLRLGVEQVIAHDGIARINFDELATLIIATDSKSLPEMWLSNSGGRRSRGAAESAMSGGRRSRAACPGSSFQWLRLDQPLVPRRRQGFPLAHSRQAEAALAAEKSPPMPPLATTF